MEEAAELGNYLPLSFKTRSEQDYIAFLWDAFETNYTHGKYQFAFLAYHMLTMSCVYFNIWQIKQTRPEDFEKGQTHSRPVIEHAYREFLLQNHDPEEREYPDAADQIREMLVHGNYLSQMDIEICLGLDLASLAGHPQVENMHELHEALKVAYGSEDERSAS